MFSRAKTLSVVDPDLAKYVELERVRQDEHIELIASENYTSPAVMEVQGSQLTNKYAEGYPGKRYYGGCEFVDVAEQLAIDRVKALFGAEAANTIMGAIVKAPIKLASSFSSFLVDTFCARGI